MSFHIHFEGQRSNPEFQSAVVRLGIWVFMLGFIGIGATTGYYPVSMEQYYTLFVVFFFLFAGLMISVLLKPVSVFRQYLGLVIDIAGTSYAIVLSQNPINPIFLLYIWIFISYGTRYGKEHLLVATLASVFAYAAVVTHLRGWENYAFEAYFFLIFMALLPMYQSSLIKKLHDARVEAEQANRARGRFLATMTHEIRTPLSGIIGMARVMETANLTNLQKEQLNSIKLSADKLEMLIGDILDFSRIDAEKLELHEKPFDAQEMVFEICRSLAIQSAEKGVEMHCTVEGDFPAMVEGDPLRFSQIVSNLVSNAIKFTDRGEISVTLSYARSPEMRMIQKQDSLYLTSGHLVLQVVDTGIGISEKNIKAIFDPFHQADNTSSRRYGGAGLGMAISRNLVELMNGQIDVRSEIGQGSEFSVILPLPVHARHSSDALSLPSMNVLLLDSDPQNLHLLKQMAEEAGINLLAMQSAGQLKNLSRSDHFDLLLIGESARQVAAFNELSGLVETMLGYPVPLVVMTYPGRILPDNLAVAGHLKKPFSQMQFVEGLNNSLELDRLEVIGQGSRHEEDPLLKARHVLVAEDDPINASLITALLKEQGHTFHVVEDGYAALNALRTEHFDLAFIDLRMPYLDGIELAGLVRKESGELSGLPLIALTANASEDARRDTLDAGMNEFLVKPISPELLQEVLKRYAG